MLVRVRILRGWLLGLFVAAQVVGVVPLISEHTLDVYKQVSSRVQHAGGTSQQDPNKRHGHVGSHDECCAIHSLAGPLTPAGTLTLREVAAMRVSPAELIAPVSWHSNRLDRPPKALPQV